MNIERNYFEDSSSLGLGGICVPYLVKNMMSGSFLIQTFNFYLPVGGGLPRNLSVTV